MAVKYWIYLLGIAMLFIQRPASAATSYVVTNLGDLSGGHGEIAVGGINSFGQVVGWSAVGATNRGFLWSPKSQYGTTGSIIDLGDLPGGNEQTLATAINARGQVAGISSAALGNRAFLWTPTTPNGQVGAMSNLGDLPGGIEFSWARGINSHGQVVGEGRTDAGKRGFLWTPVTPNGDTGSMVDLGELPGRFDHIVAYGINSYGQVVGETGATPGGAFLWSPSAPNGADGSMINLGTLTPGDSSYRSIARAINSYGQVIGASNADGPSGERYRSFLWIPTTPNGSVGSMVDLGDSSSTRRLGTAEAINSHGQVVGESGANLLVVLNNRLFGTHAYLWKPHTPNGTIGELVNLNDLLSTDDRLRWTLTHATAVNDRGQIAGIGLFDPDGPGGLPFVQRAFLLTQIPEPSVNIFTLFSALFAFVVIGRRR